MALDANPWKAFDKIYCINLEDQTTRKLQMEKMFTKLNIPVEFYFAQRDKDGGKAGCYRSHIQCIRKAFDANAETALIFEDDAIPSESFTLEKIQPCVDFMTKDKSWNIFFLGCVQNIRAKPVYKPPNTMGYNYIYKVNAYMSHAYVIHRRYMKILKHSDFVGVEIDALYCLNNHAYGHIPSLFIQDSNLESNIQDRNGSMFSLQNRTITRTMESYCTTVNYPVNYLAYALLFSFVLLLIVYIINPAYPQVWLFGIFVIFFILLLAFGNYDFYTEEGQQRPS